MQLHVVAVVVEEEAGGILDHNGRLALETVDLVRADVSFGVYFAPLCCSHEYIVANVDGALVVGFVGGLLEGAVSLVKFSFFSCLGLLQVLQSGGLNLCQRVCRLQQVLGGDVRVPALRVRDVECRRPFEGDWQNMIAAVEKLEGAVTHAVLDADTIAKEDGREG
jgi:hypothetical protein